MAAASLAPITTAAPSSSTALGDTHLEYLCRNTQACVLRPYCFFVSWQGVLTLAYRGFPQPLAELKQQITDFFQGLPKESPGSKWPKTSLACLREGKRLTPQQLQRLNEICRQQSGIFQTPGHKRAQSVLVDTLSTIVYETRCLERVISRRVVQLSQPADVSDAPAAEMERVQGVVAEADDDDYWFHASKDGNREKHYRTAALGVTLVHEMGLCQHQPSSATAAAAVDAPVAAAVGSIAVGSAPRRDSDSSSSLASNKSNGEGGSASGSWTSALPCVLAKFREAVEAELPELYAWFDDASLHITVRAIIV